MARNFRHFLSSNKGASLLTLAFFFIVLIYVGHFILTRLFDKSIYKGFGYSIVVPPGWEQKKVDNETVMFICPEKDPLDESSLALISFFSKRIEGALWMDDYIRDVKESLRDQGLKIIEKGQIKMSGQIAQWILYRNSNPDLLVLTFYIIDDFNRLFRIQYVTKPEYFAYYRQLFERVRESFRINMLGLSI